MAVAPFVLKVHRFTLKSSELVRALAWPALGADQYEVQWSKAKYPWRAEGEKLTYATSALLPVTPGSWWYRIRGINFSLPGTARAMTWSDPVGLRVAKPTFAVVKKSGR